MKSRPLTYLLLVAALGVWGVVAWKLFSSGPKPTAVAPPAASALRNDSPASDDTLRLDYPDPFCARPLRNRQPGHRRKGRPDRQRKKRSAAKLACTGRIRKQGTDHYLVSIDGRVHLLRQGQRAGDFTLRQVRNDSLVMARDTECYLVKVP
ncbi:MAG: hypothetical protein ACLR8Y_09905 [Alistipes indistinctus]